MRDTAKSITDLYQRLRPHILRDIQPSSVGAGSGGAGMVAHSLAGAYHTGTLLQSQAPWAATKADLAALTDTGMIHDRVHELASTSGLGADHTVSGLTAGQYLRASGPMSAAFAAIQDADIPSTIVRTSRQVLAGNGLSGGGDLSANRTLSVGAGTLISVSTTQVSVASGSAYQYIGTGSGSTPSWRELSELAGNGLSLSGAALTVNVSGLGLSVATDAVTLTSSSGPGAAASILASDATGKITLPLFVATTSVTTPTLASGAATELAITSGADTYLNPGSNIVKLGTDKLIRSYSFTSGFAGSGWQIDQSSGATNAEFDNLTVRGTMRVYELLIQQIRATNGSIFVTAAAKLASASLISGSSYDCYVEGDSGDYAPFAVGDVLRAQRVNLGTSTVVYRSDLTVTAISVGGNPLRFTATLRSGTTAPAAGMEFVRLGSTSDAARRGSIYLTADDSGAPFIDVVNGVTAHTDWNTVGMVKVRIGRLDGITGNSNEYGIWAGTGTSDTAQSIVASSASVSLNNVPLRFKAGSSTVVMELAPGSSAPYMALGSTLPTGPLVGNGLWMGKDGSDYEFRVGTVSGGALVKGIHWDGSNLTWKATNTTLDASGNLTATNAVLSGQVTATSGAIGGWSLSASGLTATNIGLYSGAANTARVEVGASSNVAGVNSANGASDIAFWAGSTHANRASAPFRVTAGGSLYGTTGTIAGDFTVSGSGKLIAGGSGVILDTSGVSMGLYGVAMGTNPGTPNYALSFYTTPSTRTGLQTQIYSSSDSGPYLGFVAGPELATPVYMTLWNGGANRYLWFSGLTQVVGLPGLLLADGSPDTVQVLSGARLQLNSGSTFVATTHLEAGVASTYDLGTSGVPWRKLYADEVVAGTITGSVSLGGQTWQYDTADMYIRSSSASARTLYISNPSTGSMSLDVEGSITVGGTVDGVDLAAFKSAYDVHTHDTRYYTETELQTSGSASVHWNNLTNKPSTYAPSAHALVGADHTASGLTAGHVVKATGATTFAWAQLAHSDLSGIGTNTHSQIDTHIATSDTHVAHSGVSITAGAGLTGGGTIAASRTLAVGAGYGITVNADDVALASTVAGAGLTYATGVLAVGAGSGITVSADSVALASSVAGSGLTYTTGVLAVGAGDGISVSADAVSLASSVAGNGLTYTTGVLAVGVSGLGLSVAADAVTLTSSSNPGAAAAILASDASGYLRLVRLGVGVTPTVALEVTAASGQAGIIVNRVTGQASVKAGATDGYLIMDSSGQSAMLNYYVADNVILAYGGGRVGIGTTAPQATMEIYRLGNNSNAVTSASLLLQGSGNAAYRWGFRTDTSGNLHFDSNYSSADVTRFSVLRSGYVGIDTTAPESKLHVSGGSVRVDHLNSYTIENSIGNVVTVATVDAGNILVMGGSNINAFQIGDADAYIASTGAADNRQMSFFVGNASEKLTIAATGYVGINDTTPSYQLDVNGTGRFTGTLYADSDVEIDGDLLVGATVLSVNTAGTRVGINREADSQFDLDVAGAIRGQYLVGRHAIQLPSAVGVWHFDGPQPYNLDFTGAPESHAGVAATVTNGIYRPGRFGKALQIAPATTNYVRDPSFETAASSTSSESPYFKAYNLIGGSSTQSTDSLFGGYSQAINVGTQADPYLYRTTIPDATLAVGQVWTFSAWVKAGNQSAVGKNVSIRMRESGNTTQTNVALTREWQRVSVTRTLTVAGNVNNYIVFTSAAGSGDIFLVDGVQIEQKPYATPFAVGDMGDGHSWTSTAFTTPSIRAAGSASFGNVINRNAFTVAGWLRPLLSENDTTSLTSGFKWRFQVGTYSGNPSLTVGPYYTAGYISIYAKNTTDAGWSWYATGSSTSPNIDFAAGEWIFVAMTWNGSEVSVYATKESNLDIWDSYTQTGLASDFFGTGSPLALSIPADGGSDLWDEVIVLDYAADEKLLRSIAESDAPVFVESSVFHWRSPSRGAQIWVDEFGLWGRTNSGDAMLGLYGGSPTDLAATTSWAGVTLGIGDLTLGSLSTGAVFHWDNDQGAIRIGDPGAEHVFMDGATLEFRNSSTTITKLDSTTLTIGVSGSNQIEITSSTLAIKGNGTDKITLDASGNASIAGVLQIGTSGEIRQGSGTLGSNYTGLRVWNSGGIGMIAGYNNNVQQWYASTDGKLYAGSGNVRLDSTGIAVNADTVAADPNKAYSFLNGSTKVGGLTAVRTSEYTDVVLASNWLEDGTTYAEANRSAYLNLWAFHNGAGKVSEVQILAGATSGASIVLTKLEGSDPSIVITASHTRVTGGVTVGGDAGGLSSTLGLTNSFSGVSTGAGTVKMNGTTYRDSAGWIKMYNGTTAIYVPYWTTITG